MGNARAQTSTNTLVWLALVAGSILMLFPIYWIAATAVRPRTEIFEALTSLVPAHRDMGELRQSCGSATRCWTG